MKKMLLTTAIAVFGFIVNAQTEKGKWIVGGNTSISFASTKATIEFDGEEVNDDAKSSAFTITPSVGYFVMDNLSVGVDLSFTSQKNDDGDVDVTVSSFSAIPGATYYFEAGDKLKPFVGAGVGIVSTSNGDDDSLKSSGLAIRGKGGLAYFINDMISIDFSVQYINTTQENKEYDKLKAKNSSLGVGIGLSLFL